jgi:lysophospholipase L1-like esterase
MVSPEPEIKYYRVRNRRHSVLVVLTAVLGVVALGAGAAWGLGRLQEGSSADVLDVGDAPGDLDDDREGSAGTVDIDAAVDRDIDATAMGMVGDSITAGSTDAIRYTLAAEGFDQMAIDGETSRRIEEGTGKGGTPLSGIRALYGMLAEGTEADVWVIALGTNDVGQYDDPAEYRRLVQAIVDMIPQDVPLVWIDVFRADRYDESVAFNEILRDVVGEHADSIVMPWFDHATNADEDVLRDDGVHPNTTGNAVFANLVADGIAAVS